MGRSFVMLAHVADLSLCISHHYVYFGHVLGDHRAHDMSAVNTGYTGYTLTGT